MSGLWSSLPAACAAVALAACSPEPDQPRVITRDSAGIRIVESRAPAWDEARAWTVDTAPMLSIGVADGAPEYQLHVVRGALRMPDGRIVIGDGGSGQLRFYDGTGTFLHAAGRRGHGPGEFGESVMRVWSGPDGTIVVEDGGNDRLNVFSDAGWFVRAVQLEPPFRSPAISPLGLFEDGSVLALVIESPRESRRARTPLEYAELSYVRFAENGVMLNQVLRTRGSPRYVYTHRGSVNRAPLPFAPAALHAVLGGAVAFSTGSSSAVEVRSPDRTRRGLFRWEGAPRRRVEDVWERYRSLSMERLTPAGRESYRYFYSLDLPLPEYVPSLERLLGDAEGNLWAKRYLLPWETSPEWDVLSPDGEWLGTVVTPRGLTVIQIGSDFVLGTHRDELGVERVRLHALRKPRETRRPEA